VDHVYTVNPNGTTVMMDTVICKNEDKELQCLLLNNFDLLPGDQIDPEAPCRWMLIKREMPVPDPYTGVDRWSMDFFFVDQNATPTFVECKRFLDTGSRRKVIGQVLEYAANGQYYWSSESIRSHAELSAKEHGTTVDELFQKLNSEVADSTTAFFEKVERRLQDGKIRIVFFLEQAPSELKRLVEFLNKQMTLSEVLLVEARQYTGAGVKIVVPKLFGFTEQARAIRRAAAAAGAGMPVASDWESFAVNARSKGMDEPSIGALRKIYDTCKRLGADISWGRGTTTASLSPKWPSISSTVSPFSVNTNGNLDFHFGSLQTPETARVFSERLAELIGKMFSLPTNCKTVWYTCSDPQWMTKVDPFMKALEDALPKDAGVTPSQLDVQLSTQ